MNFGMLTRRVVRCVMRCRIAVGLRVFRLQQVQLQVTLRIATYSVRLQSRSQMAMMFPLLLRLRPRQRKLLQRLSV